eukprot:TRINITY_DN230_c2_g1_i2.p1 TRINITY_DN230_c2_g1~~TRINITY_DN230_c2_g1_i2.p1  ORF type:complete len:255 (+),score=54.39 TRINITY_DN230_c2_g1_i2:543-1307(+)
MVSVSIPVIPINPITNKFQFPKGVKRVWMDVGAHREAMHSLPYLDDAEDLVVIAFEPLYDMWGELKVKRHHPRLFPFPGAVSEKEGYQTFRRSATDMCSSLNEVDNKVDKYNWPGGCAETSFDITVPVIRLDTVINMIPFDTIEFLKVDAQGHDLNVVKSAGDLLKKIKAVVVEVQHVPLYKDQPTPKDYSDYFTGEDFTIGKHLLQGPHESNMLWYNNNYDRPVLPCLDEIFEEHKHEKYVKDQKDDSWKIPE